jgi:hypothetical protein
MPQRVYSSRTGFTAATPLIDVSDGTVLGNWGLELPILLNTFLQSTTSRDHKSSRGLPLTLHRHLPSNAGSNDLQKRPSPSQTDQ